MARNTFGGLMRSYGADRDNGATPGVVVLSTVIAFDPTSSSTQVRIGNSATVGNFFVLPRGAIPISVTSLGGITGGASPTVDIGTSTTLDAFFNEVSNTVGTTVGTNGSAIASGGLTATTPVYGRVGASAGTGGTFVGILTYTLADDGADASGV